MRYLLFILPLLFLSCPDDDQFPNRTVGNLECLTEVGFIDLRPDALAAIPYLGRSRAIFLNPAGTEVPFSINDDGSFGFIGAFEGPGANGAPTVICYDGEIRSLTLASSFADFQLDLRLVTAPNEAAGAAIEYADVLLVSLQTAGDTIVHRFTKAVEEGNSTASFPEVVTVNDTAPCAGNYGTVERTAGEELFYSETAGIVSFLDPEGGRWCLVRVE